MAGDDDEMFMTRSLNITPKTTKQHLIVRSDKYVAYVTNNKRLRSTFCTILKLTTDRHETSRGLLVTAQLLVVITNPRPLAKVGLYAMAMSFCLSVCLYVACKICEVIR